MDDPVDNQSEQFWPLAEEDWTALLPDIMGRSVVNDDMTQLQSSGVAHLERNMDQDSTMPFFASNITWNEMAPLDSHELSQSQSFGAADMDYQPSAPVQPPQVHVSQAQQLPSPQLHAQQPQAQQLSAKKPQARKRYATETAQRSHNEIERRYRASLNKAIQDLRKLLPDNLSMEPNENDDEPLTIPVKETKAKIIKSACNYILDLCEQLETMRLDFERQQSQNLTLRHTNTDLMRQLETMKPSIQPQYFPPQYLKPQSLQPQSSLPQQNSAQQVSVWARPWAFHQLANLEDEQTRLNGYSRSELPRAIENQTPATGPEYHHPPEAQTQRVTNWYPPMLPTYIPTEEGDNLKIHARTHQTNGEGSNERKKNDVLPKHHLQ